MPIVRWDNPEQAAIWRAEVARGSRILGVQGGVSIKTYRFDTAAYPLAEIVTGLLVAKGIISAADAARLPDLTHLHHIVPRSATAVDSSEVNEVSRAFFETSAAFDDAYQGLIRDVLVRDIVGADCLFQRSPTIRFHFPNQEGCFWHPRVHNDQMLGHPPQEINVWLPLGKTQGTSGMRIAPLEPSVALLDAIGWDYARLAHDGQNSPEFRRRWNEVSAPVELAYGELIVFEPRCIHAPQYNVSDLTRVSLDFRIIPVADYDAMGLPYRGTGRRRMPFARGAYYHEESALSVQRALPASGPALATAGS